MTSPKQTKFKDQEFPKFSKLTKSSKLVMSTQKYSYFEEVPSSLSTITDTSKDSLGFDVPKMENRALFYFCDIINKR